MELDEVCNWCGWTVFKRQCGKDYVGETACFGEICCRIPLRIQIKMEPMWTADDVFFGKLDLSDEVIVSTPNGIETTRSFRRMTEDRQWNPGTLRMFVGVPWSPRGITTDAHGGIRKRYITRALVQTHGATDGCRACQGDGQVHVPRCRKRWHYETRLLPGISMAVAGFFLVPLLNSGGHIEATLHLAYGPSRFAMTTSNRGQLEKTGPLRLRSRHGCTYRAPHSESLAKWSVRLSSRTAERSRCAP